MTAGRPVGALLSSRELARNAGFCRVEAGMPSGWRLPEGARRIAVGEFDKAGLPLSSHAVELRPGGGVLAQTVRVTAERDGRFALRVAARGLDARAVFRLELAVGDKVVGCTLCDAGRDWDRFRVEGHLGAGFAGDLTLSVVGPAPESDGNLLVTDVRLVEVFEAVEPFRIRFLTRGPFLLPSSRLRAFLVADYLDLVGWPVMVNRSGKVDLHVCQKVRPWGTWKRARLAGEAVVYDLDDNEALLSRRTALGIALFSRAVDGVCAGSDFLAGELDRYNDDVFVLENMVDVFDRDVVRGDRAFAGRLVWFGMPENEWMLDRVASGLEVTRITRGGDLEYDPKGIDRMLTDFDLALLPVEINEWTRAKNANRMVKCAGLGLPFLASDTEENRRAADLLGIGTACLVASERDWPARIAEIGAGYDEYRSMVMAARETAFDIYGKERIVADWVGWCRQAVARRRARRWFKSRKGADHADGN